MNLWADSQQKDFSQTVVAWLNDSLASSETQFVEIRTSRQSRSDLGRPTGSPVDWKNDFISALKNDQ